MSHKISREDFIEELEEGRSKKKKKKLLREWIRKRLKEKKKNILDEKKKKEEVLRSYIRKLIKEAKKGKIPYDSTGINILEDVLDQIIPIVREDYKSLTTDEFQRKSFRKHIIEAIKQTLLPIKSMERAPDGEPDADKMDADPDPEDQVPDQDSEEELPPADRDVDEEEMPSDLKDVDDEKMIDVDDGEERKDPDEPEEEEGIDDEEFEISGEDKTGRNLAMKTYNRIEEHIIEGYRMLSNEEDEQTFYDWLISNLRAYFQKWEDELEASPG